MHQHLHLQRAGRETVRHGPSHLDQGQMEPLCSRKPLNLSLLSYKMKARAPQVPVSPFVETLGIPFTPLQESQDKQCSPSTVTNE